MINVPHCRPVTERLIARGGKLVTVQQQVGQWLFETLCLSIGLARASDPASSAPL